MVQHGRRIFRFSVVALLLLAACHEDDASANRVALCEQIFRVDGQNLYSLGAGCSFYGSYDSSSFYSDLTSDPDLKLVATISPLGLQVTATSHGVIVAKHALSESQLETGEKLIFTANTFGGDTYEFRYWGSRTIDPAQYMDGIDGGWVDGGWKI